MLSLKSAITFDLCLKEMAWKLTAYHVHKSDIGLTVLKQK